MRLTLKVILIVSCVIFCINMIHIGILIWYNLYPSIWDFVGFYVAVPGMIGSYIILMPPMWASKPVRNIGEYILRPSKNSDVLLVISESTIQQMSKNNSFYNTDWSYAWINFLEKEFGCYACIDVEQLNSESLHQKRFVILTKSITAPFNTRILNVIENFVNNGGDVIIERPVNNMEKLTGIRLREDKPVFVEKLTWVEPACFGSMKDICSILSQMPFKTELYPAVNINPSVQTLIKADNYPAICWNRFGKGHVISLLFNYGLLSVSFRQGVPNTKDFKVTWRLNKELQGINTPYMVFDKKLLNTSYPYMDIFEGILVDLLDRFQPIPRLWYYPGTYESAILLTFDEDYYGDSLVSLDNLEKSSNNPFTFFIIPDSNISTEALRKLLDTKAAVGIHWNRFVIHFTKSGIHWNKYKSFMEQKEALIIKLPPQRRILQCNRIHYLKWDKNYVNTFRILFQNGIEIDSSFGPGRGHKGYLFGTGFPYYPIDENGGIIKVLELPFQSHEPFGNQKSFSNEKLVEDSCNYWNTTVVILFHPYFCMENGISFAKYKEVKSFQERYNLWCTNMYEYLAFWKGRTKSLYYSQFNNHILTVNVVAERRDQSITIPLYTADMKLEKVYINGKLFSCMEKKNQVLLPVAKGSNRIEAHYKLV